MYMRYKFTPKEAQKIEELVKNAINASTKAAARKYSNQLSYIGKDVVGYSLNVYSELTASVCSASGAVREKDRLADTAQQLLWKFKMSCVETET